MSKRASSSQLAAPPAASSSKRFANRRQERVRGAAKHDIIPRKYNFGNGTLQQQQRSSSRSTSSTPAQQHQESSTQGTSISSTPAASVNKANLSSTPAMSVRSGRLGLFPSSSPSRYIDPRLLADQGNYTQSNQDALTMPSPSLYGRMVGDTIEQRRLERLRGAGTHQIEPRYIQFGKGEGAIASSPRADLLIGSTIEQRRLERLRGAGSHQIEFRSVQFGKGRASDAASSDSLLDRFMESMSQSHSGVGALDEDERNGNAKMDWIEQRRMERRRGGGAHAIEEMKAAFGRQSGTPSSLLDSGSILEEQEEGNYTLTQQFDPPSESTPTGINGQIQPMEGFDLSDGQEYDDMDFGENQSQTFQSPGSMAAQRSMDRRRDKRQGSPVVDGLRKIKSGKRVAAVGSKKVSSRRLIDLGLLDEADETVAGQADETLQEQREAAFTALEPPSWTFPINPVTKEDLSEMKIRVQEMVTLALGNEAGAVRTVKVNDADVLWSIVKKEIKSAQQNDKHMSSTTSTLLDQLLESLLPTFTHLSQQSAERSQLIYHLIQARRRNLHIRKQVFQKRSQVLKVARTMQALKRQEMERVQQEEDDESSLQFLTQLHNVSHEWS